MSNEYKIIINISTYCNSQTKEGTANIIMTYGEHNKKLECKGVMTTDNAMALYAVTTAFAQLKKNDLDIIVRVSNTLIIDSFKKGWVDKWSTNGWKKSDKKPVENKDLWAELFNLVKQHTVQWELVKK